MGECSIFFGDEICPPSPKELERSPLFNFKCKGIVQIIEVAGFPGSLISNIALNFDSTPFGSKIRLFSLPGVPLKLPKKLSNVSEYLVIFWVVDFEYLKN